MGITFPDFDEEGVDGKPPIVIPTHVEGSLVGCNDDRIEDATPPNEEASAALRPFPRLRSG